MFPGNEALISTGFLDTVNDVGIASPIAPLITGSDRLAGQLGKRFWFNNDMALRHSSVQTAAGRIYNGVFQYVKATSTLARGQIVIWDTLANTGWTDFEVTSTIAAAQEGFYAGIALGTVTSGNYCFIQVGGLAQVLFRASVTAKTLGNIVVQLTTTNTADAIADATGTWIGGGVLGLKNIIGSAYQLPADGLVTLVALRGLCENWG